MTTTLPSPDVATSSPRRPRPVARRTRLQRILQATPVRAAIVVIAVVWSLPTAGILISSFRERDDINTSGWWTVFAHPFDVSQWTIENYADVLSSDGMFDAFVNSVIVAVPATVIPITIAAFAGYAFAWMDFPGRGLLFAITVGLLVVPLQMALIPILRLYGDVGLSGTFLGTWLAHTGFGLPLAVYLLYNYISQLPRDLIEAASVDGASHFQIFTRLVLPLSMPAIAAFAIFQFLWVWNDLLVALVFLGTSSDVAVVTAQLSELVGSKGQQWHLLTAGAFVSMVIPLLVFFALQRHFVRGLLAGSVKG